MLFEFAGASHFLTTNDRGTAYDAQSRYMIAFHKVYLEDDMRYLSVLDRATRHGALRVQAFTVARTGA